MTRSWRRQTVSTVTSPSCSSCATLSTISWRPGELWSAGESSDPSKAAKILTQSLHQVGNRVLPGHRAEPHGVGQLSDLGTSCSGLLVGHTVRPSTQQDLLDDGHHLHRGSVTTLFQTFSHVSTGGRWFALNLSTCPSTCLCPQVTIVIKYFFQFGFFPFNQKLEVDRSKPFHPPNILGVEKKEGYVLYDLLQLLALFHHRAILKVRRSRS